MLENLTPAPQIQAKSKYKPGIEFDGSEGTAVTPGYDSEPENFDAFLIDAGLDPDGIEVIPPVRTSRWQQQKDGELVWLTSYRFTFRRKATGINLPLLLAEAQKKVKLTPLKIVEDKALVVLWSDLQVGKVDYRGNSQSLIERVGLMQQRIVEQIKREKPSRVVFADMGDTVENFSNAANMQQLQSNDLSIMEQVDLATTFAWQTLKLIVKLVPDVTYASIGSNHCQWRVGGQVVGKATDDWGVYIGRQLARLAQETELPIRFIEPQPHDESLALDVFGDGFHILGLVHGHQVQRPEGIGEWWKKQAFGRQPVSEATILCHGHFHHLRVTEMGSTQSGGSRFVIMASTLDNGSGWYKKRSGEDSVPGLVTFLLEQGVDFTGTVYKL
jgi:hypothetical protein